MDDSLMFRNDTTGNLKSRHWHAIYNISMRRMHCTWSIHSTAHMHMSHRAYAEYCMNAPRSAPHCLLELNKFVDYTFRDGSYFMCCPVM